MTESGQQVVTHQPAISFSISIHFTFKRAGGRTSNVVWKMIVAPKQDSRARVLTALGVVSLWFAFASVLSIYSDARVAMTIGDRYPALFEQVALWISIILQPWIVLALALEPIGGAYFLSTSLAGSVVGSFLSWTLLYSLLARLIRRFHRATWVVFVVLATLSMVCTYSFFSDINALPPPGSHSGP
jgi:hypothetical protein